MFQENRFIYDGPESYTPIDPLPNSEMTPETQAEGVTAEAHQAETGLHTDIEEGVEEIIEETTAPPPSFENIPNDTNHETTPSHRTHVTSLSSHVVHNFSSEVQSQLTEENQGGFHLDIPSQTYELLRIIQEGYIQQVYNAYLSNHNLEETPIENTEEAPPSTEYTVGRTAQTNVRGLAAQFENDDIYEEAVNFYITTASQIILADTPNEAQSSTFAPQSTSRLLAILRAAAPAIGRGETLNEDNPSSPEQIFFELANTIYSHTGEANFSDEEIIKIANFLQLSTDHSAYLNQARSGIHSLEGPSNNSNLLANAIRDLLNRNQIEQISSYLLTHSLPNTSSPETTSETTTDETDGGNEGDSTETPPSNPTTSNLDLLLNFTTYSQVGFTPNRLNHLIETLREPSNEESTDTQNLNEELAQAITTQLQTISFQNFEDLDSFTSETPITLSNQDQMNPLESPSKALSMGMMVYLGVSALSNLIYGLTTQDATALSNAALFGALATVATDVAMGNAPFSTLGNLARGIRVSSQDIEAINGHTLVELVERTWLFYPSPETEAAISNPILISTITDLYDGAVHGDGDFSYELLQNELYSKMQNLPPSEQDQIQLIINGLEANFDRRGATTAEQQDQLLFGLAHSLSQLEIHDEETFAQHFSLDEPEYNALSTGSEETIVDSAEDDETTTETSPIPEPELDIEESRTGIG